jgi:hypothetical protein
MKGLDTGRAILEPWELFLYGDPDESEEEALRYWLLLERAHEQYKQRFTVQERRRED